MCLQLPHPSKDKREPINNLDHRKHIAAHSVIVFRWSFLINQQLSKCMKKVILLMVSLLAGASMYAQEITITPSLNDAKQPQFQFSPDESYFLIQLGDEQQQEVNRLAPTHIVVPSGSKVQLRYRKGSEVPVLSVRLQECFGLTATPRVNDGKMPVLMELLSPGFKPVQLTADLQSFWQDTYFEVRKELRRRYPKHYWPDNPLEAVAQRGVKRKR